MDKQDYKKVFKDLYLPKNDPGIIEVPSMKFACIDGKGDPNGKFVTNEILSESKFLKLFNL